MPFVFGGVPYNALGSNDANNTFDSSLVVSNADGSVLERLEFVQSAIAGLEPVAFTPSSAPAVDEDGGRTAVTVSVVDRNTGLVASGSIDITSITYSLERSTAGGAFSAVGVTQPSGATKASGLVRLEWDFTAAEWAVGDAYRLEVGGVTATVGATTYYMGTLSWVGTVLEDLDVKTAVDLIKTDTTSILTDTGDGTDAAVQPAIAGSLHGHIREAQEQADLVYARQGAPAGASMSADIAAVKADTAAIVLATDTLEATLATIDGRLDTEIPAILATVGTTTIVARATISAPASTESDIIADHTIASGKAEKVVIQLDLTNLTVAATINLYQDGGAAGTTPTLVDPSRSWTTSDKDVVVMEFTALSDYKVTVTTGAEGANRDIYARHMYSLVNP